MKSNVGQPAGPCLQNLADFDAPSSEIIQSNTYSMSKSKYFSIVWYCVKSGSGEHKLIELKQVTDTTFKNNYARDLLIKILFPGPQTR